MEFRDAVRYLRSELGLTQAELAAGLRVNALTVGRWENGRTAPNRSMAAVLTEFARSNGASEKCLDILGTAIASAAKNKLGLTGEGLYCVEHASLRQLVDESVFPIYVRDVETDEILYVNRNAEKLASGDLPAIGKKCYSCIMHRDTPCPSCRASGLGEDCFNFKPCNIINGSDGVPGLVQGKLIMWNGRRAQVSYVLEMNSAETVLSPLTAAADETGAGTLTVQSISSRITFDQLGCIFENINGGISVAVYGSDGKLRMAYANDRYYDLFGYTKEQFRTELKAAHDTLHPDDAEYVGTMINDVKTTHRPATFKYRIIKRDGTVAYLLCNSSYTAVNGLGDKVLVSILSDISETVRTEQQSLIYGQRLSAIMDSIPSGIAACEIKDDGSINYVFVTDRFYGLLGYTREQYAEEISDPFSLIYNEDAEPARAQTLALKTIGESATLKFRAIRRDGKVIWLKDSITVMNFADSTRPVQLSVFSDITDLVEAEAEQRRHFDRIAEMMNMTPAGIKVIEVDPSDITGTLRTVYYNERFISYSGCTREEYEAGIRENEFNFILPEDIPTYTDAVKSVCGKDIGFSSEWESKCRTKSGGYRWLQLAGQLVSRHGSICTVTVSMFDITARKEAADRERVSEEMLRIAAETDKRAIIIYNIKENTCHVESRTLHVGSYGETIGNIPQSLIDRNVAAPDSVPDLCAMFERIRSGKENISVSLQLNTGDDEYQWFECNATTVYDSDGQADRAVLVFHNITEQRIKEAVYKKWQQSIVARPQESFTLFRCNLSKQANLDEWDGKLLKIDFGEETLFFNDRSRVYAEQFVFAEDRAAYVALLNSDTLLSMYYRGEHTATMDYREIEAEGELCWRRLTVELVEYLNSTDVQAFLLYEDIDADKKAELKTKELVDSDPLTGALNRNAFFERVDVHIRNNPTVQHAMFMIDMDGFKQVNDQLGHDIGDQTLMNVIAVVRSLLRPEDMVCRLGGDEFLIWLNAVEYSAVIEKKAKQICEQLAKTFDFSIEVTASLGIAVYPRDGQDAKSLYRNSDKALYKVKSAGKNGYSFYSASDGDDAADTEVYSVHTGKVRQSALTKRRMLIVDDNELNRTMLKNQFNNDFIVETAKNGNDALIQLRHFGAAISIVLLDLGMPGIGGFEVLKRMQDNVEMRTIPVIIVSVDSDYETSIKAIECGAADYITKPVDPNLIRVRVRAAINKTENERLRAQNSYLMLQRNED